MSAARAFHIVLKARPKNAPFFIAVMQAICAGMQAHPTLFLTPPVDLATFKSQLDALSSTQQTARARIPGAAATRDQALAVVAGSAELLRAYVEQLCNASPESGVTIAQAAAMQMRIITVRAKVPLRARQGAKPGVVLLYASVSLLATGRGGRYFSWSYSVDGGRTWVAALATPKSRTTITGLPVLTECSFRVSVTDNVTGPGPWTAPLPFLVH